MKYGYLTKVQNKLLNSIENMEKQTAQLKKIIRPEIITPEHIPVVSKNLILKFREGIKTELDIINALLLEYEEIEKQRKFL